MIRQRDAKQIINAAKKMGAKSVEFQLPNVPVIVHLTDSDEEIVAPTGNEWLANDANKT